MSIWNRPINVRFLSLWGRAVLLVGLVTAMTLGGASYYFRIWPKWHSDNEATALLEPTKQSSDPEVDSPSLPAAQCLPTSDGKANGKATPPSLPSTLATEPTNGNTAPESTPATPETPTAPDPDQPSEPEPDSDPPECSSITVAFYADSQSDSDAEDANHRRVVEAIMATDANPVFHAGDLLEDGTIESRDRFNAVTQTLRAARQFYAAQGNNERNSAVYFDNFIFPGNEHWFSVNVGNLHLVVLDNYASSVAVGSSQYNWLLADLQSDASQQRITAVMFHYPPYGVGGDLKGMIPTVVPLFEQYGVDFVISGHEHSYQRSSHGGVTYFVLSGQPSLGYLEATVQADFVDFTAYNNTHSVVESLRIAKR